MKLFLLTQKESRGYDTYNAIIVCAEDELKARDITPCHDYSVKYYSDEEMMLEDSGDKFSEMSAKFRRSIDSWATSIKNVKAEYIGEAREGMKEGIILTSFNAG